MELRGDAVKIDSKQLDSLLQLQELLVENAKLEQGGKQLATGGDLEAARERLLSNSSALNAARSSHEEILRELRRVEGDLELVEKREKLDRERLSRTAVSRDALGIQHELETLAKRRGELEEIQLEVLERKDDSDRRLHSLAVENEKLDQALGETKTAIQLQLGELKQQHAANLQRIQTVRAAVSNDVLEVFDKKIQRGIAIGRLSKTACGACNMNLTATAMSHLHEIPQSEMAFCPECQAILIR